MIAASRLSHRFLLLVMSVCFACTASAQPFDSGLTQGLHWRMIGPFRGGRTVAITGVPGKPNVFFMAPNNGGVWKTHRLRPYLESDL